MTARADMEDLAAYLEGKRPREFRCRDGMACVIRAYLAEVDSAPAPKVREVRPSNKALGKAREEGRSQGLRAGQAASSVTMTRLRYLGRMLRESLREAEEIMGEPIPAEVPEDIREDLDRRTLLLVQILTGVEREISSMMEDQQTAAGGTCQAEESTA